MVKKRFNVFFLIFIFLVSCSPVKPVQTTARSTHLRLVTAPPTSAPGEAASKTSTFFTALFKKYPLFFDTIIQQAKDRNIQIIYTQVDRDENNFPKFRDYYYNLNPNRYFYPASTVKLPVALLALQRLNELKSTGITLNTTMITDSAYSGQTAVYHDPNASGGKPAVGQYIKRIFLVSDNDAFNRLYEFLGQEYINDQLHKKGYATAQVLHRLDIFLSEDENRHTNPVKFLDDEGRILYRQGPVYNPTHYEARNDSLGKAFYKKDSLIRMPMNFSRKNRITLASLHKILRSLIFPNTVMATQRFKLTPDNYKFIYHCMSEYPGESIYPSYDTASYPDGYIKFLKNGRGERHLPKNIRIFNKSGEAYGQLTDIAYIVDFNKNIEFFLSATINCTRNGIVNDDNYDYEAAGYPFLEKLGKVIYDLELRRKRPHVPDLSSFKFSYDK